MTRNFFRYSLIAFAIAAGTLECSYIGARLYVDARPVTHGHTLYASSTPNRG